MGRRSARSPITAVYEEAIVQCLEARLLSKQIEAKFNARTMAIDPVDNLLYVACYLVDILVIDIPTDRVVKRMTIGPGDIKKIAVGRS